MKVEHEDENDHENDIEDDLQRMISDQKDSKKKQKNIIIIIISLILALVIIGVSIFLLFMLFKKGNNTSNKIDEPLVVEPKDNYSYCLIFLHGLEDRAENFKKFFESVYFSKKNSTKIIFIRAPINDLTYKNKHNVRSWFDIFSFPMNSSNTYNFDDAKKSKNIITETINKEVKLLNGNYSKIIIGGHSQGACMSLYTGYNEKYLLGGVMALCGIFFEKADIVGDKDKLNVLLFHGETDEIISFSYHNKTVERISKFSGVEKKYYPNLIHDVNTSFTPLLLDIEAFLNKTQN